MSLKEFDTSTGHALAEDTGAPGTPPRFAQIPLEAIVTSLTNRTHFDADKMTELAASIAASGVHQPILVRPLPGDRMLDTSRDVQYEIVSGERRYRASLQAQAPTIPAVIRALTDNQVLEIQIIENLQREDLTALEEAEGYERLMATGLTAEQIGDKIGKSRRYVYARIQLQGLCAEARTVLSKGQIDFSRALLIARIPDPTLQIKTTKEFCATDHEGEPRMSLRACQQWVRSNVMLILKDARFQIGDALLVPSAGACTDCPKRTGANPDLFADVDGPDMCTDPHCYSTKQEAYSQRAIAEARNKGLPIIEGKEALELRPHDWNREITGFSDLDYKYNLGDGPKPLRDQIEAKAIKGKVTLFVDPHTGEHRHLIPDDLADKLTTEIEQKHLSPAEKKAAKKQADQLEKKLAANQAMMAQRDYHQRWRQAAIEQIEPCVRAGEVTQFDAPVLRAFLVMLADEYGAIDVRDVARAMNVVDAGDGIESEDLIKFASDFPDIELGSTLLLAMLFDEGTPQTNYIDGGHVVNTATPVIDSLASTLGIDLDAIRAEIQDQIRAENTPTAKGPAARPKAGAGGKAGKPRSAKLTAEQATTGIADAMQGLDDEPGEDGE